jgi:hypothetical protein
MGGPGMGVPNLGAMRGPQGPWAGPRMPPPGMNLPSPEQIFALLDTDKNGVLSKEEFVIGMKKLHERMQAPTAGPQGPKPSDHAAPGKPGPQAGPPQRRTPPTAAQIFEHLDKNKDGKLTQDEVPAPMWERMTKGGLVKDNAVTKDALDSAFKKAREGAQKRTKEGHDKSK